MQKPLWLDSNAVTADEIIRLSVVRTAHLAATSDINLQQRATHWTNPLLNVQTGVPVGEKHRVILPSVHCLVGDHAFLPPFIRRKHSADINCDMCMKNRV